MKNEKGSILVHVLVTGLVIAVIAAGILRITLQNYTAASRMSASEQARQNAEGALYVVMAAWNTNNANCTGTSRVTIANNYGDCRCNGTIDGVPFTASSTTVAGRCTLQVRANYSPL